MPPLPNNQNHGGSGGGSSKKKKKSRNSAAAPVAPEAAPEAPEHAPEDVADAPDDQEQKMEQKEQEVEVGAIPTEEPPKPTQNPDEKVVEEEPKVKEKASKKSKKDKKKKKKVVFEEAEKSEVEEDDLEDVVVEEKEREDSEVEEEDVEKKTVAPTAEETTKISGKDLVDFSSSDDNRSSLSSRPIVKDSPDLDEDDDIPTRPVSLPKKTPEVPIQPTPRRPQGAPPAPKPIEKAEEMLVDMSLDDDHHHPSAPPRKSQSSRQAPPPIPSMNTIISLKPRANQGVYPRGQMVKQSAVEQQTLANQMADLMAMGMSGGKSQSQGGAQIAAEKAEWVQLQSVEKAGDPNDRLEVLIVGLGRGYQIWTMGSDPFQVPSDFEEVLSERQGPIRALKVLPNNLKLRGKKDPFSESRPLIAIVDAQSHHPDRQYCSVSIKSLVTGKEVHKLKFDEPVCAVNVSDQFLVVSLAHMAYAYSILTFDEVRVIRTAPSVENNPPALSLSGQLLAYADTKLDSSLQSSGGLAAEVETAATEKYTDHLFNAMSYFSRGVKSISESVGATSGNSTKNNQPQGVISVLNLSITSEDESEGVMCHYVAHVDPISYISFSPDQRLVLSADASANGFNIFLLMPHPTTSSLASVQHLYKLNRGNTPAKVISSAFSEDCRWLAITTNHATTHVFAVCPFGGKPNQRTHGDTFVNKESRFHRSAGLTDAADVTALIGPSRHRAMADSCSYTKEHPIAVTCPTLAKTNGNARVGPFPPPLLLTATEKIKDSRYTKEDLTAWAADITSFSYQGAPSNAAVAARKRLEVSRMSVLFRMRSSNSTTCNKTSKTTKTLTSMSLIIAKVDPAQGVIVTQHEIKPIRKETAEPNLEAAPLIDITPVGGWILQRTKNNADIHAPLNSQCPLMANAVPDSTEHKMLLHEEFQVWTPHVETRTFSHPPRWLWQGPQFGLFEYREDDQPSLMSPGNKGSNASFKSIPVLVGSEAISITKKPIPADATRIECGSYTSANSYSIDQCSEQSLVGGYSSTTNGDFVATIADAMRDINSDDDFSSNSKKKTSPRAGDDDEFFDTESSTSFARNGSGTATNGTSSNGKSSSKKKKTPPASAPLPSTSSSVKKAPESANSKKSNGNSANSNLSQSPPGANRSGDSDDFSTFDMDDV